MGHVATLLDRLEAEADGSAVALGLDLPLGVPHAYAALHAREPDFPRFLRGLASRPGFFEVCSDLDEVTGEKPFYPRRGRAGMTRASHAAALGLDDAAAMSRRCDRKTTDRPAGAPLFWTLGANQVGKAASSGWRDLLIPALLAHRPVHLWPFEGRLGALLARGGVSVAETYPAEALRHLGLRMAGSKRRQPDRAALAPGLLDAMAWLAATPDAALRAAVADGFGARPDGEDRFDSLLGLLCLLNVLAGHRDDAAPADHRIMTWEGWVLGQHAC